MSDVSKIIVDVADRCFAVASKKTSDLLQVVCSQAKVIEEQQAALDAIRKAAEEVDMASPMAFMESLAEFHALVYAQTHPDKPEALCDAHAEKMMEGKDEM